MEDEAVEYRQTNGVGETEHTVIIMRYELNSTHASSLSLSLLTECIVCVQGRDTLTFSCLSSFLFFDWVGILWPQLSKVLKHVSRFGLAVRR